MRSLLIMPILIDSHCDLAWNMLCFGRDYKRSAAQTRELEKGSIAVEVNGDTLLGWPDYQRGKTAIVFSTLYAAPRREQEGKWDKLCYDDANGAHTLYSQQLDAYHALCESGPDFFQLILNRRDLDTHMRTWRDPTKQERPVGLVVLMEGADGIRNPDELAEWHERGLRLIGLAWAGTRYSGGTKHPGPLTDDGRQLLKAMAGFGFVLDLSHMDEMAALEALDLYDGPIVATHVNCLALLPEFATNRHFSDTALRRIIERGGIIGNMPVNAFLKTGWSNKKGSSRDEVPLSTFIAHIDHVCQLAGDSLHSAIGTDFDGGFGVQSVPPEIDTIADVQKVAGLLEERGYAPEDAENVFNSNWLKLLSAALPG